MELTDSVELRPCPDGISAGCSEVLIGGRPTGHKISGQVLEACVRCDRGWLLFATDGTPSEDMLSIHFLDGGGAPLDCARIGGAYTTGSFSHLRLSAPATVHFRFIDDAAWSVRVLESPRRALPWWPDARGVWRGSRLKRYFAISRELPAE